MKEKDISNYGYLKLEMKIGKEIMIDENGKDHEFGKNRHLNGRFYMPLDFDDIESAENIALIYRGCNDLIKYFKKKLEKDEQIERDMRGNINE